MQKKGFQTHLEMNKLLALSANIILRLRTAERMITPGGDHQSICFIRPTKEAYRWHVGTIIRDPPTVGS